MSTTDPDPATGLADGPGANCDCAGEFPSDTLANIRTKVLAALGFLDPVTAFASRTQTLATLRDKLASRLGFHKGSAYPPDVQTQLDGFLNDAQQQFFSRIEQSVGSDAAPAEMVADTDSCTLDWLPLFNLAAGMAKAHYGQGDAKIYLEQYQAYLTDLDRRLPPNALSLVGQLITAAQDTLYKRYEIFQAPRWYTWPIVAGTRFYDIGANTDTCAKKMEPGKVQWVGISQGDVNWQPLICGIDPMLYTTPYGGIPTHYEIRQCIEIWPAAADSSWYLRAKGQFALQPFAADTDTSSVDPHAIYLKAAFDAKAWYKQSGAAVFERDLEQYIGDLTAETHETRRYIPGYVPPKPYVPPKIA